MCSKLVLCFILSCGGMVCCFDVDKECQNQYPNKKRTIKADTQSSTGGCTYICKEGQVEIDTDNRWQPDNTSCGDLKESKVCLDGMCVTVYDIELCKDKLGVNKVKVVPLECTLVCSIKDDDSKSRVVIRSNGFSCRNRGECQHGICRKNKTGGTSLPESTSLPEIDDESLARTPSTTSKPTTPKPTTPKPMTPTPPEAMPEINPTPALEPLEIDPTPEPTSSGISEPPLSRESFVDPSSNYSNIYKVDMTSLCRQQYRSETTIGVEGNNTYGCMYFCFYDSTQLNQEPLFAPDETPCGGKELYACSSGFCQRKWDIKACKHFYRKYFGYKTKVTGYRDKCFFKCETVIESGSYDEHVAVEDGLKCKSDSHKPGKCLRGFCIV